MCQLRLRFMVYILCFSGQFQSALTEFTLALVYFPGSRMYLHRHAEKEVYGLDC